MKTGKLILAGFLGLSLTAFALPCWGSVDTAAPTTHRSSTLSGAQYAGGPGVGERSEHEEHHEYTAPAPSTEEHEEHERMEHRSGGEEEEHGGTRNFMKEHVPGTAAHQEHEEREGEEHHPLHHDEH